MSIEVYAHRTAEEYSFSVSQQSELLGFITASRQNDVNGRRAWMLSGLRDIHEDCQHTGVATKLIESVIDSSIGGDYLFVNLADPESYPYTDQTLFDSHSHISLYQHRGFEPISPLTPLFLCRQPASMDVGAINHDASAPEPKPGPFGSFDPSWHDSPARAFYCRSCNSLLKAMMLDTDGYAIECPNTLCGHAYHVDNSVYRNAFEAWDAFLAFTHEKKVRAMFGGCRHAGMTPHVLQPMVGVYVIYCSACKLQLSPAMQSLDYAWNVYMPKFEAKRARIEAAPWEIVNAKPAWAKTCGLSTVCACKESNGRAGTITVAVTEHVYYHTRCTACNKQTSFFVSYESAIALGMIERIKPPAIER